jgi:hypothetical protein
LLRQPVERLSDISEGLLCPPRLAAILNAYNGPTQISQRNAHTDRFTAVILRPPKSAVGHHQQWTLRCT